MGRWEYLTIDIALEHNDFVVTFTSGRKVSGLKAILDEFDGRGWGYINMVPNLRRGVSLFHPYVVYFAFFRRPRAANSSGSPGYLE
jgi:hypothetical protein